jgi:hypothetical protein
VGIWLQQDSYRGILRNPITLHRYAYGGANPVTNVELYGFGWREAFIGAIGGAVGGAVVGSIGGHFGMLVGGIAGAVGGGIWGFHQDWFSKKPEEPQEPDPDPQATQPNNDKQGANDAASEHTDEITNSVNEGSTIERPYVNPTVPHIDQLTYSGTHGAAGSYLCSAASFTMTLQYFLGGSNVSYNEVADALIDQGYLDSRGLLSGDYLQEFVEKNRDKYNVEATYYNKTFDAVYLVEQFNSNSLIVANVPGHYTLITGYRLNEDGTYEFHINDPYRGHWTSGSNVVLNNEWISESQLGGIWEGRHTVVSAR